MSTESTSAQLKLNRKQLFMLPTRGGIFFGLAVSAMFLIAIRYSNGLAYLFTFLLGSMAVVSMLYTHRNASGLRISCTPGEPVFAGQDAGFSVYIDNLSELPRHGLYVHAGDQSVRADVPSRASVSLPLGVNTKHRGYAELPPLAVSTAFPLGLFYTWSRQRLFSGRCLVYPKPGPKRPIKTTPDRQRLQDPGNDPDGDDFIGLRDYQIGDPPRHIHWKAVARGQDLQTKRFGGEGSGMVWLDWRSLPELSWEARLSQLCRWVLDSESAGTRYGLRLPGETLAPAQGVQHRHQCLAALALFQAPLP